MDSCKVNSLANSAKYCFDQDLKAKITTLPEGKTKHFFVSYTSVDKERVYSVINEVEKRFGLQCVFDERDFQGGKDIIVNIREGMIASLKVLLFLSPSFLDSGWCKYETDAAFISSMGCGYSCIVPVLLEECEIPPTLVTLTYIDATIPGLDVPAKIASSLSRPATEDDVFPLNFRNLTNQYENGYSFIITAERDNLSILRPAKFQFSIGSNLMEKLKENKVKVPEELLKKVVDIVNGDLIMSSYDYMSRLKNCAWSFLLVPLFVLVYQTIMFSLILQTAKRERSNELNKLIESDISLTLCMFLLIAFSSIVFLLCFLLICCHSKKRDKSLQTKLWKKVGKECIDNNVLLLFSGRRDSKPILHAMRYNIGRCKEYFVGIIKARNITPVDETLTPEEYADMLIERHLSQTCSRLADDFDLLPEAPYNRHNVKKGKMCICQQLEHNL